MKKIVIIGNSTAVPSIIEAIRRTDQECTITMVTWEECGAYQRRSLSDVLVKNIDESQVVVQPDEFYQQHRVICERNKKIAKINFKRCQVVAEDKTQFSYDVLIVADTLGARFGEIKGTNKAGACSVQRLDDIRAALNALPLTETICMQADSLLGLQMACALKKCNKETLFILPSDYLLSHLLDREPALIVQSHLVKQGMRVIAANGIVEVLGDGDAKAVKLANGKVIASQLILLGEERGDLRIFNDSDVEMQSGLLVDGATMRTSNEHIYAIDRAAEVRGEDCAQDDYELACTHVSRQADIISAVLSGQEVSTEVPLRVIDMTFLGLSLVLIGETKLREGCMHVTCFNDAETKYKKFLFKDNVLIGAVLINAQDESERLIEMVRTSASFDAMRSGMLDNMCSAVIAESTLAQTPEQEPVSVPEAEVGAESQQEPAAPMVDSNTCPVSDVYAAPVQQESPDFSGTPNESMPQSDNQEERIEP